MGKRIFGILKGAFLSLIITLLLAAVLAAVMYFLDAADGLVTIIVFIIGAASTVGGGFWASRTAGSKGLITGAGVGLVYFLILAVASLMIKKEITLDAHMAIMLAATAASGMLGGVLGIPE